MQVGPYVVEGLLGQGGMGTVHKARHTVLNTSVALKELVHPDPQARQMLLAEARLLFGKKHPNFPTVLDLLDQHGRTWLVMDFIEGPTLTAVVNQRHLTASEAVLLGHGLCHALIHLHASGVLHRDIKPDNILLPRGLQDPVLVDLGIAGAVGCAAALAFTPGMAPPEQEAGAQCTAASDVYQVGATLLFALTGQPPPPASKRTSDADLGPAFGEVQRSSPALAAALARAMMLDAQSRPSTAARLTALLSMPVAPVVGGAAPVVRKNVFDIRR